MICKSEIKYLKIIKLFLKLKITFISLFIFIFTNGLIAQEYPSWTLNTFPGPGHKENPGPWGPGQGASRREAIQDFGVSPVNGNFMMMLTDLSSMVYTNDEHPNYFKVANIPVDGGVSVAFNAHDENIGYALMGGAWNAPNTTNYSKLAGWWRTDDQGETWDIWYSDLNSENRNYETYGDIWGRNLLISDPHNTGERKNILYFASFGRGLVELDDRLTYDTPNGGDVIAFDSLRVKTVVSGLKEDTTILFAIVQESGVSSSANKDNGGELYKLKISPLGNVVGSPLKISTHADWTDIVLDPNNPGKGLAIRNFAKVTTDPPSGLVQFDNWGNNIDAAKDITPPKMTTYPQYGDWDIYSAIINPANSDHVVLTCHNGWAWQNGWDRTIVFATNATSDSIIWQKIDRGFTTIDGEDYVTDFKYYGPPNYYSKKGDYAFQRKSATQDGNAGTYSSVHFVPGAGNKVRFWAGSWSIRGPLESADSGATFVPFAHGGTNKRARQVSVFKDGSGTLHMANASDENGLYVSHDGGLSWEGYTHESNDDLDEVTSLGSSSGTSYNAKTGWGIDFKPDPADAGQTIIACYGTMKTDTIYETFILRSTNGGTNWTYTNEKALIRLDAGQNGRGHNVQWGQRASGGTAVYVGNKRSRDDGLTWTTLDYDVFAISAADADVVVGTKYTDSQKRTDCNFYFSLDGGDNWTKLTAPDKHVPMIDMGLWGQIPMGINQDRHFLAIDPNSKAGQLRILFANAAGILIYEGAGNEGEWQGPYNNETASNGIYLRNGFTNVTEKHFELSDIYFDPRPGYDSIVYAANDGFSAGAHDNNDERLSPSQLPYRRVFRSTDRGITWEPLITDTSKNTNDYMAAFGMDVGNDGKLYISDWGGVYIFEMQPILPNEVRLSNLSSNKGSLSPSFHSETFDYLVALPVGTTDNPVVTATALDPNAAVNITQVSDISGSKAERTATVVVISDDKTDTNTYTVVYTVLVNELEQESNFMGVKVYPVPAKEVLHVKVTSGSFELNILDLQGRTILRESVAGNHLQINCSGLIDGVYLVQVFDKKGKVYHQKIIINKNS